MSPDQDLKSGRFLPLMEEFFSLQGEGYHTGEAAWFIRLGGCDVGCHWCDVKESWNADLFPAVATDQIVKNAVKSRTRSAIITGGEPLLYNLSYLCRELKAHGFKTFLETSGSLSLSGEWDYICLSPKQDWPPREQFYPMIQELKVIITHEDDFQWAEKQASKTSSSVHRFLQPEWSCRQTILPAIIRYIKTQPGWRLSLQIHKYIGIP